MAINYLILLSRQGKVRLAKWFTTLSPKEKAKIIKDVTQLVLSRRTRMCNFLEYKDSKVVYRRYASLFFIAGCSSTDNELITLEIVHRYVEQMDKYYGNVCELDIIFNFQKAYFILDELLLAGEMQESSKKNVLRCISQQDSLEDMEVEQDVITRQRVNVTGRTTTVPSRDPGIALIFQTGQRKQRAISQSSTPLAIPYHHPYIHKDDILYPSINTPIVTMKFLPLSEFEDVTSSLNFDTPDCLVVGGCDLYTTKAAGGDKKLYRSIEDSLESQYESLLQLSASLSPPNASSAARSLNLSRSSPFGPLSEHSSRRTFAYMIATLNASHPDHDFSHVLRPTDFHREKSLRKVMNTIDTTLFNLRPRMARDVTPPTPASSPHTSTATHSWGPRMWKIIDTQMSLKECSIYCYSPEEDPYDGDEGIIWRFHYFFFNKARKRVCYLYLRGISVLSQEPLDGISTPMHGKRNIDDGYSTPVASARKRARYWLGDGIADSLEDLSGEDEDEIEQSRPSRPVVDDSDNYLLSDEEGRSRSNSKTLVRALSEEIADSVEV
ncbi:RNA polymerase III-inhibiting protein maf1 [Myotisia sp. PD_48]|nr:RNA polymerase III-inhibiting protein maf1 [Myotisia sp. PD_48]